MRTKQSVPPMVPVDRDVTDTNDQWVLAPGDGYDVFSWSPGAAGAGVPSTQVHLAVPVVDGVRVVLRLKSARALDELVGVLLQHRKDVWG